MDKDSYIVVKAETLSGLTDEVNAYIRLGWEPLGGVCSTHSDLPWFYQAMIGQRRKGYRP